MSADEVAHLGWTARTLAAQALGCIDELSRGVVPPIHVTTTYLRDPDNQYRRECLRPPGQRDGS